MKSNALNNITVQTKKPKATPFALRCFQWGFRLGGRLSPSLAARYAYQLWFTPMRYKTPASEREVEAAAEIDYCPISLSVNSGKLKTYKWGAQGPLVLLVHGWSGRGTQLGPYVQPLLDRGYQVLSFDLPAHGGSVGKQTTLLEATEAIKYLAEKYGQIDSVISHSFGGPCTALALKEGLSIKRFVAVCPPAETEYLFESFCKTLCLTKKTVVAVQQRFEKEFGKNIWSRISMTRNVSQLDIPGLIVHDEDDFDVSWRQGERAAKSWPGAQFVKTSGLGHRRILKDAQTIERIMEFIRPE